MLPSIRPSPEAEISLPASIPSNPNFPIRSSLFLRSTVNCQPFSFASCQLSTVNCQLSTVNCQLSTVNCQLSTVNSSAL
ncbi:MAG: hypothetical protein EAZ39_29010 [Oscillatoriales cyanobacterium]|nr:MAG: hypothetical protein EAZ45_09600 [Oscillatoriales cyanobacterium]TAG13155.1 MAG: hypothetical protein EAZ39_29010 [Oscillatoriales cyanobacterium]TAG36579.1 MAG: hypothetical protein EAZ33_23765 [Oscillatoriales cyanobacterium]TAG57218.1 MAG: hypothetical protein EAZ28_18165 [Oscillatoriales cyanobacterium]